MKATGFCDASMEAEAATASGRRARAAAVLPMICARLVRVVHRRRAGSRSGSRPACGSRARRRRACRRGSRMISTERLMSSAVSVWPFGGCACEHDLEAALQVEALAQLLVDRRARDSEQDDAGERREQRGRGGSDESGGRPSQKQVSRDSGRSLGVLLGWSFVRASSGVGLSSARRRLPPAGRG